MSEENKMNYCTNCGAEVPEGFKFCSNCGTKIEVVAPENPMEPVYEKIEAEIVENSDAANFVTEEVPESPETEAVVEETMAEETPVYEEELNINYDSYNNPAEPASVQTQYYASGQSVEATGTNGNIGFSIGSMVCGILSLLCCCSGFFGLVLSIGAIVLGVIAIKNNYDGKGMAIAGLITGGIAALFAILMLIIGGLSDAFTDILDEIANY